MKIFRTSFLLERIQWLLLQRANSSILWWQRLNCFWQIIYSKKWNRHSSKKEQNHPWKPTTANGSITLKSKTYKRFLSEKSFYSAAVEKTLIRSCWRCSRNNTNFWNHVWIFYTEARFYYLLSLEQISRAKELVELHEPLTKHFILHKVFKARGFL